MIFKTVEVGVKESDPRKGLLLPTIVAAEKPGKQKHKFYQVSIKNIIMKPSDSINLSSINKRVVSGMRDIKVFFSTCLSMHMLPVLFALVLIVVAERKNGGNAEETKITPLAASGETLKSANDGELKSANGSQPKSTYVSEFKSANVAYPVSASVKIPASSNVDVFVDGNINDLSSSKIAKVPALRNYILLNPTNLNQVVTIYKMSRIITSIIR